MGRGVSKGSEDSGDSDLRGMLIDGGRSGDNGDDDDAVAGEDTK